MKVAEPSEVFPFHDHQVLGDRTGQGRLAGKGSTVVDVTPYIIVDNQKISPNGWSPRSASAVAGPEGRESQPFGIADRVTISREAREQFKRLETHMDDDLPIPNQRSNKAPVSIRPLLPYSPKIPG